MQFQLRVPEGFRGRIYTHKVSLGPWYTYHLALQYYGRSQCYVRGNGGNTYTLRIPGVGGFPDCGTEKVRPRFTTVFGLRQYSTLTMPR